jgi:hypothetical protein
MVDGVLNNQQMTAIVYFLDEKGVTIDRNNYQ